jgi:2-amino-4,5-dihydroxy-6-oxo-7-(phosphonooxy)heptanoate synthase
VPVIVAGGPSLGSSSELRGYVTTALRGGAGGVAMGRNIFQAADPGATARMVADLVHAEPTAVRSPEPLAVAVS